MTLRNKILLLSVGPVTIVMIAVVGLALDRLHTTRSMNECVQTVLDASKSEDVAKHIFTMQSLPLIVLEFDKAQREIATCADTIAPASKVWFDELSDCADMLNAYMECKVLNSGKRSAENERLLRVLEAHMKKTAESRRAQYRYPQ